MDAFGGGVNFNDHRVPKQRGPQMNVGNHPPHVRMSRAEFIHSTLIALIRTSTACISRPWTGKRIVARSNHHQAIAFRRASAEVDLSLEPPPSSPVSTLRHSTWTDAEEDLTSASNTNFRERQPEVSRSRWCSPVSAKQRLNPAGCSLRPDVWFACP